jgi:hypothetical protein
MYSVVAFAILGSVLAVVYKVFKVYRQYIIDWEKAMKTGLVCIPGRKYISIRQLWALRNAVILSNRNEQNSPDSALC